MEASYLALHQYIRNDLSERKNMISLHKNQKSAISHLINDYQLENFCIDCQQKITKMLENGKGVWVVEWERRNNGDGYIVVENSHEREIAFDMEPNFTRVDFCDREDCGDL
jgi:hypothetical protein